MGEESDHLARKQQGPRPDSFAWLFGTGHTPAASQDADSAQLECAVSLVREHWQVAPVTLPRLLAWLGDGIADPEPIEHLHSLAVSVRALSRVQNALARRLADQFDRHGIPYCFLKGAAVRLTAYDEADLRAGLDIDIAVPKHCLDAATAAAGSLGFLPAATDARRRRHYRRATAEEFRALREVHHELGLLVRKQTITGVGDDLRRCVTASLADVEPWYVSDDGAIGCYVAVDVHFGLSLEIPVDDLLASSVPAPLGGRPARVPSAAWMVFHLIYKLYWEGVHHYRQGAYQYADLTRLMPLLDDAGAQMLLSLVGEHYLEAAAHYVLRRLGPVYGIPLPPSVEDAVRCAERPPSDASPREVNDLGDMWPKIWGFR